MARALITGISGFTGKYLAASLQNAGYQVFGCSLHNEKNVNIIQTDLSDLDALRKLVKSTCPDIVAHLGGVSFVGHENLKELYCTNILGTRNLLQSLSELDTPPKAVMLASSGSVYGNTANNPITENSELAPLNDYAVSKLAMEKMSFIWKDKLPIFIVRPFNYTGVGQTENFLIPKIIKNFANKSKSIKLGNLNVFREFNDVRFIVKTYCDLFELAPIGKIINICSGNLYSLNDIITIMNQITGYEIEVKVDQNLVRENEVKILQGSKELLQSLIGPLNPISINDTLAWMLEDASIPN